jgi:hypothetical protein
MSEAHRNSAAVQANQYRPKCTDCPARSTACNAHKFVLLLQTRTLMLAGSLSIRNFIEDECRNWAENQNTNALVLSLAGGPQQKLAEHARKVLQQKQLVSTSETQL